MQHCSFLGMVLLAFFQFGTGNFTVVFVFTQLKVCWFWQKEKGTYSIPALIYTSESVPPTLWHWHVSYAYIYLCLSYFSIFWSLHSVTLSHKHFIFASSYSSHSYPDSPYGQCNPLVFLVASVSVSLLALNSLCIHTTHTVFIWPPGLMVWLKDFQVLAIVLVHKMKWSFPSKNVNG